MNRILIIASILIVSFLAYTDAKERLKELDEVAANTPAQVEMKPIFNNNAPEVKFDREQTPAAGQFVPAETKGQGNDGVNKNNQPAKQDIKDFQQKRNDDIFK